MVSYPGLKRSTDKSSFLVCPVADYEDSEIISSSQLWRNIHSLKKNEAVPWVLERLFCFTTTFIKYDFSTNSFK